MLTASHAHDSEVEQVIDFDPNREIDSGGYNLDRLSKGQLFQLFRSHISHEERVAVGAKLHFPRFVTDLYENPAVSTGLATATVGTIALVYCLANYFMNSK
jgi:hypothetical protein